MARGDDDHDVAGVYADEATHSRGGTASTAAMAERFRRCRTVAHFNDWVRDAQPGARVVYGFGVTAVTAAPPGVAARLMVLANHDGGHGLVALTQRRVDRFDGDRNYPFDYIATRTAKPCPARFPHLDAPAIARHAAPTAIATTNDRAGLGAPNGGSRRW